jgi:large subunit ribosomal protein L24
MNRLRVGDRVRVISGKDKGKEGRIAKVLLEADKVVVEGLNMIKRHQKPNQLNPEGKIIQREAPLFACKVMPLDPQTGKPTRVKIKTGEDGTKTRVAKSGAPLPVEELRPWPSARCRDRRSDTSRRCAPRSRRISATRTPCSCHDSRRSW